MSIRADCPVIRMTLAGAWLAAAAPGAFAAPFSPTLEWSWTSSTEPGYESWLNVMNTPSVIDLDGDGSREIVFSSTAYTGGPSALEGVLRVLDGVTGLEKFTVTDPNARVNAASSVATGDIDGDGLPEIVVGGWDGTTTISRSLIAFEHDGTVKWKATGLERINWGAPAIANVDPSDPTPEIVIGRQLIDEATGAVLWTGAGGGVNGLGAGPLSAVSDIDLDGSMDIVAGDTVYNADGTVKWQNGPGAGASAVGNFDADPEAEVVVVRGGTVSLLDTDGTTIWGPVPVPLGGGGAPTIADFDSDGEPEIGVAGAQAYTVFETDGTVKWTNAVTQDVSSQVTGSSVFDFEGDGSAEVIYGDEKHLWVFDGKTGTALFSQAKSSCTWYEYPLVADIDGDARAEILAVANNNCGKGPQRGVFAWGDPSWIPTREIWNQHTYHITNVNLDGTVPQSEQANWLTPGLNNFRLNEYAPGESPPSVPEPGTGLLVAAGLGLAALGRRRSLRAREATGRTGSGRES